MTVVFAFASRSKCIREPNFNYSGRKKEEDGDRKTDIQKIKVLVFMIFTRF